MEEVNVQKQKMLVSYCWKGLALFLLGMLFGFLIAPVKKGVSMFNNNGNENTFEGNSAEFNDNGDAD